MSKPTSPFLYYTHDGHTVRQGHLAVTPRSQVIGLKFPFAALIWNRPLGVTIVNEQSKTQHYQPIIDVTRLTQWGFYAVVLLLLIYKKMR
ncbi:MAG: hypothetical protein R6X32_06200 [Chloroflexota bacterium]|jgi:hypothetical protein